MRPSERFVWGKIVEEWEIGPYHIAKYQPFKTGLQIGRGCPVDDTKRPHTFVASFDRVMSHFRLVTLASGKPYIVSAE